MLMSWREGEAAGWEWCRPSLGRNRCGGKTSSVFLKLIVDNTNSTIIIILPNMDEDNPKENWEEEGDMWEGVGVSAWRMRFECGLVSVFH
jgi:hypothetical protein